MSKLRIKQISNTEANSGSVIAFDGSVNIWQKINHTQSISVEDLDEDGVIVIDHGLGRKYVTLAIYDENDFMIIPDSVKAIAVNELQISLYSFLNTDSDWTITVS